MNGNRTIADATLALANRGIRVETVWYGDLVSHAIFDTRGTLVLAGADTPALQSFALGLETGIQLVREAVTALKGGQQ